MLDWLQRPVVIVAAHPDDETIGAGAQLANLRSPLLVHVTDGAPLSVGEGREKHARARRDELKAALRVAGAGSMDLHEIGIIDQDASYHLVELVKRLDRKSTRLNFSHAV